MNEIMGERGKEAKSHWFQSHLHLLPSHRTLTKKKGREEVLLFKFPANIGSISRVSAVHWHTCFSRTSNSGHESYNQWLDTGTFSFQLCPQTWEGERSVLAPIDGVFIPDSPSWDSRLIFPTDAYFLKWIIIQLTYILFKQDVLFCF